MKRLIVLIGLSAVACGRRESIQERQVAITDPPPVVAGCTSKLAVPASCPVYAPGGGDVDTPELPFPPGFTNICAVDDAGQSYGIADGDAPTAQVAVLPGNHELGVYLGFDTSAGFSPERAVLAGANPAVKAWAGSTQRELTTVAVSERGILLSVGSFDGTPLEVTFLLNTAALFVSPAAQSTGSAFEGFYVNGPP
jgi:hypothetical protein